MPAAYGGKVKSAAQVDLSHIVELRSIRETITARVKTGIGELDRVLGGRHRPGQRGARRGRAGHRQVHAVFADGG